MFPKLFTIHYSLFTIHYSLIYLSGDILSRKKWVVSHCDKDLAATIAENCGIEPFAAFLLCARGMTDEFEIESFLYDTDLIDPFTLPDMEKACERIHNAIENGEKITVFGDYDADGVTSTALLYSYLLKNGASVDYYIPDRTGEGYGMNTDAIDALKARGTSLIVTVDNGISALEEVNHANALGLDVVITDHHKAGEALPNAVAVVDPHREDCYCEFREWAGVGVAFKLICALDGSEGYSLLEEYGDIVALGTVADIVSLKSENRIIVRSGVAFMNAALNDGSLRKGFKALIEVSGSQGSLDATSLAFRFAPRINAAGRMGSAERALKLLLTDDIREACALAEEISEANAQRQAIEGDITKEAIEIIEKNPHIKYNRVIVVEGKGWHQGVIGIVASRLVEKYGKPCIVITENDGVGKGSGRSLGEFSLYDALSYCADSLVQYGGHTLAAGLTVEKENIEIFREKINEYAKKTDIPVATLNIDCKLNPASISTELLSSIALLEPYGAENPSPVFGLYNMEIGSLQPVGNGKHLRLNVKKNGYTLSAIMFSQSLEGFPFSEGDKVDLAIKLSENEYMGKVKVNIQVKDIKLSGSNDEKLLLAERDYEDFSKGESLEKGKLFVDRDFCGKIYKYIKSNNGWKYSAELLCHRLGLSEDYYLSCKVGLDILSQLGIVVLKDGKYYLPKENVKNPLENSPIFKRATE